MNQFQQKNGRAPEEHEIASHMGISVEKVRKILNLAKDTISLDNPVGDDDDSTTGDFIADTSTVSPVDATLSSALAGSIKDVLDSLTPREAIVLKLRYGIETNRDHTLEEVGQILGVTRERVRQIEAKALRKLRHQSRVERVESFFSIE